MPDTSTVPTIKYKMKPLPPDVQAKFEAIAAAETFEELSRHFLCGFELETMRSFGKTLSELQNEFQQWQVSRRFRAEDFKTLSDDDLLYSPKLLAALLNKRYLQAHVIANMDSTMMSEMNNELLGGRSAVISKAYALIDALPVENLVNLFDDRLPAGTGEASNASLSTYLSGKVGVNPEHLETVRDGTVDGPEWRTRGGRTAEEFMRTVEKILSATEHRITTGCSFHVHISVPGITAAYSANIQRAMTEYILSLTDVPDAIRTRWKNSGSQGNFLVRPETGKYALAAFNPDHGTWEFRCWGNVSTVRDAAYALEHTMRAYQYQARRYLAGGILATTATEIGPKGREVLNSGTPLVLNYPAVAATTEATPIES